MEPGPAEATVRGRAMDTDHDRNPSEAPRQSGISADRSRLAMDSPDHRTAPHSSAGIRAASEVRHLPACERPGGLRSARAGAGECGPE